jgi:hypothetical protein
MTLDKNTLLKIESAWTAPKMKHPGIQEIWNNSIPFNQFWKSYFYMILRPKHHLRVLNFAYKIIVKYNVEIANN